MNFLQKKSCFTFSIYGTTSIFISLERITLGGNQRHFVANVGPIGTSAVRIIYIRYIHTFIHIHTCTHTYIRIYIQQLISQFRRISPPGVSSSDTIQAYTYLFDHDYFDPDPLPPLVQLILEFLLVFRLFLFSKRLLF